MKNRYVLVQDSLVQACRSLLGRICERVHVREIVGVAPARRAPRRFMALSLASIAAAVSVTVAPVGAAEQAAPGLLLSAPQDEVLSVPEGGSVDYTVVLTSRPSAQVLVAIAPERGSDPELDIDYGLLRFNTDNWDKPQTVTLSVPQDDDAIEDTWRLFHLPVSSDPAYNKVSLSQYLNVAEKEDDTAGVGLSVAKGEVLSVPEGGTASYTVVLTSQPVGDVTVKATGRKVSVSPEALKFTSANWDQPQRVTVTARHDADGSDLKAKVIHRVQGYGAVTTADPVAVKVRDDDAAPAKLVATVSSGRVSLRWDDPHNTTISGYQFRIRKASGRWGPWIHHPGSNSATVGFTLTGLTAGKTYTMSVRAVNTAGPGPHSKVRVRIPPSE